MRYLTFKVCCLSTTEDDYDTLFPRILVGLIISLPFSFVDVDLAIFQSHGRYSTARMQPESMDIRQRRTHDLPSFVFRIS